MLQDKKEKAQRNDGNGEYLLDYGIKVKMKTLNGHKKSLVIGGGIAGVQAALDLADSGVEVYLIEKSPSIGGRMAQLDKTFPTNDCSLCILSPKLVEAGNHRYINIITNAEVESVVGESPHFIVGIRKKPRYVDEEKCNGCGICMTKCPVKIPDEYNVGLCNTTCIHIPFPQAVPAVALIDEKNCLYLTRGKCRICEKFCETKAIDFCQKPEYIDLAVGSIIVAVGLSEFNALLKNEYGYKIYPNVVTSMELERILSASGPTQGHIIRPSDGKEPKRIAFIQCVGSRDAHVGYEYCSAICCMQAAKDAIIITEHLRNTEIVVFGMDIRAYGKDFDRFIERARDQHNTRFIRSRISSVEVDPINDNLILQYDEDVHIKRESVEMLILSVGLRPTQRLRHLAKILNIEVDGFGFIHTHPFLPIETARPGIFVCGSISGPKDIPESVIEASGAAAAAGLVLQEFPVKEIVAEYPREIPIDEGSRPRIGVFVCHCGINIAANVNVDDVVEYVSKLQYVVHSQTMLFACSQDAQKIIDEKIHKLRLNRVVVAACTPRTHEPLFQETLRKSGLNPYLFEFANIRDQCSWVHQKEPEKATDKAKELVKMAVLKVIHNKPLGKKRLPMNKNNLVIGGGIAGMTAALNLAEYRYHVDLIEKDSKLGGNARYTRFTLEGEKTANFLESLIGKVTQHPCIDVHMNAIIEETTGFIGNFKTIIKNNHRTSFENTDTEKTRKQIEHGAVIIASGALEYKPHEYLYGEDDRVITQRELEALFGKMAGEKSAHSDLKLVAMIQCVGSRNTENQHCSRICCSTAVKNALFLKKINPRTQIFVLYRDIRTYGLKEIYYNKAREAGVIFIKYDTDDSPKVTSENGKLVVEVKEKIMNKILQFEPDLLVLSNGIVPGSDNKFLSQVMKVPLGTDGFFMEAHVKLRPVDFATDGVFVCGLAHYPKDIKESIAQAKAAVSRALTVLSKDDIETEGTVAFVKKIRCNGCGLCAKVCAYQAIELDKKNKVAVVNEALCKGCGTCAASCRSQAVNLKGFEDEQILAAIAALQVNAQ